MHDVHNFGHTWIFLQPFCSGNSSGRRSLEDHGSVSVIKQCFCFPILIYKVCAKCIELGRNTGLHGLAIPFKLISLIKKVLSKLHRNRSKGSAKNMESKHSFFMKHIYPKIFGELMAKLKEDLNDIPVNITMQPLMLEYGE